MSKQVFIQNNRPSKVVLSRPSPSNPFDEIAIALLPGSNGPYDADEIATFRANPITERTMFGGKGAPLKIFEPPVVDKPAMLAEIAESSDQTHLRSLYMTHSHDPELRDAIAKRVDEIRPARDKAEQREYDAAMMQIQGAEYQ